MRQLLRFRSVLVLACAAAVVPAASSQAFAQAQASTDSRLLVDLAIEAMGGLQTLRSLDAVRIRGFEQANMLEQSERPEGPYLVIDRDFDELRDLEGTRLDRQTTSRSIVLPSDGISSELVVAGGVAANRFGERAAPAGPGTVELAEDMLALGPERVLLTARDADSLRGVGRVVLQGVEHDVVGFRWDGRDVSVYLNRYTNLPTAVEWVRVFDDGFWGVWGDVTARVEYSLWFLEPGGLMYPRQWNESRNGLPVGARTILELEANPEVDEATFALPDGLRAQMDARAAMSPERVQLGFDFRGDKHEAEEVAPGVLQIQGMWNVGLVEQPDGIVVIEAPISSHYSEQVFAEVERRFPSRPIKALITTSDAWPHVGGIREYVARGVPIYAFDLTVPLLRRIIDAPRTRRPDRLAGFTHTVPDFEPVEDGTVIGDGPTRAVLYPVRGEGGERMMAVYFPEPRLLYTSDLVQPGQQPGDFFWLASLAEVEALAERQGLVVDTVFGMHLAPTSWQAIVDALAAVRAGS